jgi:DNA-binding CsgD family transcriptional regulator
MKCGGRSRFQEPSSGWRIYVTISCMNHMNVDRTFTHKNRVEYYLKVSLRVAAAAEVVHQ